MPEKYKKHKIVVYLKEHEKDEIQSLVADLGVSASSFGKDVILQAMPALRALAKAARTAKDDPKEAELLLRRLTNRMQRDLLDVVEEPRPQDLNKP